MNYIYACPDQLYTLHSVDVKDAEQARRQGDYKKEFAIRKAHLQDLFYNKAQVVTLLKKEEVCRVVITFLGSSHFIVLPFYCRKNGRK